MGDKLIRKGLVIGIIVLFVCVGISSAVAIKGVKQKNNDIINSNNVESIEDLPDLIVVDITTYGWSAPPDDPLLFETWVTIQNIGNASIHEDVNLIILLYRGWGRSFIPTHRFDPFTIRLDIAPGDKQEWSFLHGVWPFPPFCKLKVYVNYDKNVNESDYSNNVALQRFYVPLLGPVPDWWKIGSIRYPLLVPHQLRI